MKRRPVSPWAIFFSCIVTALLFAACSTQKNTSATRRWHAFNARYNTYFNGSQAFIEGSLEKENGHKDNFTEQLPLYPAGTKTGKDIGKQNFDRAIEKAEKAIKRHSIKKRPEWTKSRRKTPKDIEWLGRREYNPFIWKAWLLLGKSQFQKGEFEEAAATFSYMGRLYATQPAIYGISRAWLAKSYAELGWIYDAEDVITKMKRDSMDYRAVKDWDYAYCDYYLKSGQRKQAITYLKKVIKHEKRKKQRARQWYLLGQLLAQEGDKAAAYKSFSKVIKLSPPYELSFNARIAQTEVIGTGNAKKMVGRLKRMAASDNNKDYLDQVYYAIGNIHLMNRDTLKAIAAYEEGYKKATRSGIEKGVLLLTLGNIYWERQQYSDARRCYGEAIGLLDKERPDYQQLSDRSVVLDKLVPHTETIHLQDSLQYLASCPEQERNAAIDRQIELLKKKEKEERDAELDKQAEEMQRQQASTGNRQTNNRQQATNTQPTTDKSGVWYFYNPTTVSQGKAAFERLWGKRENIDNWRRSNQTVVKFDNPEEANNGEQEETEENGNETSEKQDKGQKDKEEKEADDESQDPHKREYYLAQIPFTEEQKQQSDDLLKPALLEAGIIIKDEMDDIPASCKHLERLLQNWPDFERNDETCYHLFLAYSRQGKDTKAANMVETLKKNHPESPYTKLLSNPHYLEDSRWGEHIEDSIYAATYEAFKADNSQRVKANVTISDERFEQGENRAKFLFIGALTMLKEGDSQTCVKMMTEVVEKHPTSEVAEMAGMIVKGVKEGKALQTGGFDLGDVWSRRSSSAKADSTAADTLSLELNTAHVVMLAFKTDSVNSNQMLYELAKYNFTNFLVRNFDINVSGEEGITRMTVSGFRSWEEATEYRKQLSKEFAPLQKPSSGVRLFVVSEQNLSLLGTSFSFAEYDDFYKKNMEPLAMPEEKLLTEPEEVTTQPKEEEEDDNEEDDDNDDWDGTEESNGDDQEVFDFEEDFYR